MTTVFKLSELAPIAAAQLEEGRNVREERLAAGERFRPNGGCTEDSQEAFYLLATCPDDDLPLWGQEWLNPNDHAAVTVEAGLLAEEPVSAAFGRTRVPLRAWRQALVLAARQSQGLSAEGFPAWGGSVA